MPFETLSHQTEMEELPPQPHSSQELNSLLALLFHCTYLEKINA
jgi:hypothetical protein